MASIAVLYDWGSLDNWSAILREDSAGDPPLDVNGNEWWEKAYQPDFSLWVNTIDLPAGDNPPQDPRFGGWDMGTSQQTFMRLFTPLEATQAFLAIEVDDHADVWINDNFVGSSANKTYVSPGVHEIPAAALSNHDAGQSLIAVRWDQTTGGTLHLDLKVFDVITATRWRVGKIEFG